MEARHSYTGALTHSHTLRHTRAPSSVRANRIERQSERRTQMEHKHMSAGDAQRERKRWRERVFTENFVFEFDSQNRVEQKRMKQSKQPEVMYPIRTHAHGEGTQ